MRAGTLSLSQCRAMANCCVCVHCQQRELLLQASVRCAGTRCHCHLAMEIRPSIVRGAPLGLPPQPSRQWLPEILCLYFECCRLAFYSMLGFQYFDSMGSVSLFNSFSMASIASLGVSTIRHRRVWLFFMNPCEMALYIISLRWL